MKKLTLLILTLLFFSAAAVADTSSYGSIAASSTACATANSCITLPLQSGASTVTISVSGTFVGTLAFEVTADDGIWYAVSAYPVPSGTAVTSTTATGLWIAQSAGMLKMRVRASAYTSGAAQVVLTGSTATYARLFTAGTGLPAAPVGSIQYNSGGLFAGDANLTWDATSGLATGKPASFAAGTATAPSITFSAESSLGFYRPGAGVIGISLGNLRLNSVTAPGAPTVAVNPAVGNLNGAYYYAITFVTAGGETESGTASSVVNPANEKVDLSVIPVSSNSAVTSRKIYRTAAGSQSWKAKLVATLADNSTTVYTDNVADGSLGAQIPWLNSTGGQIFNNALSMIKSSSASLALGQYALLSNSCFNCVALGNYTLANNSTGYNNLAIGSNALYNNTTAYDNIAIGYNSLYTNTTGIFNTAVGAKALYFNVAGTDNVAIGYTALESSTADYNVGVGYAALNSITSGNSNTALGLLAGNTATANTSRGIYLGAWAGRYADGSDQFYVNNQNRTNTAGDKSLSLIYGVMAAAAANQSITFNVGTATTTGTTVSAVFKTSTATVVPTGGSLIPLFLATAIGGTGQPATANMNGWLPMQDSTGATVFVPVWK